MRMSLRDVNWLGDGEIVPSATERRREVFVKVRSTRMPQPAWLDVVQNGDNGGDNVGIEVELVDGEEGVAPGQACVFYDAADGQARVLGGGFIKSVAAPADAVTAGAPQRARAAARG
jgi:tRNA-specific 2-thiouridylase